jgi:single-strand DNA-binding protein
MKNLNVATLIGNLTADPEIKYLADGKAVCKMSIAVNDDYGEKKKVNFFDITAWAALAECCVKYLKKGNKIAVSGKLDQQRWEKDGQKHSKTIIIASTIEFLHTKNAEEKPAEEPVINDPWAEGETGPEMPF